MEDLVNKSWKYFDWSHFMDRGQKLTRAVLSWRIKQILKKCSLYNYSRNFFDVWKSCLFLKLIPSYPTQKVWRPNLPFPSKCNPIWILRLLNLLSTSAVCVSSSNLYLLYMWALKLKIVQFESIEQSETLKFEGQISLHSKCNQIWILMSRSSHYFCLLVF